MHRILAIGAHPDDIELGCSGFLQKVEEKKIVVLTNGNTCRKLEGKAAAKLLDTDFSIYSLKDGSILLKKAISILETEIYNYKPTIILTLSGMDRHQDHEITNKATMIATRRTRASILTYFSPSSIQFNPNYFVSLTEENMRTKIEAIKCHKSQMHRPYLAPEYIESVCRYWALRNMNSDIYLEPYQVIRMIK